MTASVSAPAARADLAALVLRLSMGVLFLIHAGLKIFVFTPAGTVGYFQSLGLPGPLAYLVMAAAAWTAAGKASVLWLAGYFVLATIGELHLAPIGLALISNFLKWKP